MNAYRLEFELPGLPRMQNPSGRPTHWTVLHKEKLKWQHLVSLCVAGKKPAQPLKRAKLTLTRCSSVCPDPDGMTSGFKRVVDSLVLHGILENDRMENIGMPDYRWEKAPPRKGSVRVVVEEVIV